MPGAPHLPTISLQFVKKIVVQFCPWEANVRSTRNFLSHVGSAAARKTNPECKIQTVVRNDGSSPHVNIDFSDGKSLLFKSTNLTTPEMLHTLLKWHNVRYAVLSPEQRGKYAADMAKQR